MGKHKANQTHTKQRDDTSIATDSEVLRKFITKPKPYTPIVTTPHLPSFDARRFHPDPITRPIAEPRKAARLVIPAGKAELSRPQAKLSPPKLSTQVGFAAPKQVSVCIRRKTRREVLFAKQRTHKGSHGSRTRTQWSDIKC